MGQTKALIEVDGVPMARRVADAVREAGCDDIVLVGGVTTELAPLGIPVIADVRPGQGPLGGVLTALLHYPDRHVLVIACDVPYLDAETVRRLRSVPPARSADAVVARTDRREPMCAIWRPSALTAVRTALDGEVRALHSILSGLVCIDVDVNRGALHNVNRPGDLRSP